MKKYIYILVSSRALAHQSKMPMMLLPKVFAWKSLFQICTKDTSELKLTIDISGGSIVMPTVKGEDWLFVYIVAQELQQLIV